MSELVGFEYISLQEVDPEFKPIPQDLYTLQILDAGLVEFEYKRISTDRNGAILHNVGDKDQRVSMQLAVTGTSEYAGRRLWESLFFSPASLRTLRKIMDATGIEQTPGQPMSEWLKALSEVKPEFRVPVDVVEDKRAEPGTDGKKPSKNQIRWKEVMPVAA